MTRVFHGRLTRNFCLRTSTAFRLGSSSWRSACRYSTRSEYGGSFLASSPMRRISTRWLDPSPANGISGSWLVQLLASLKGRAVASTWPSGWCMARRTLACISSIRGAMDRSIPRTGSRPARWKHPRRCLISILPAMNFSRDVASGYHLFMTGWQRRVRCSEKAWVGSARSGSHLPGLRKHIVSVAATPFPMWRKSAARCVSVLAYSISRALQRLTCQVPAPRCSLTVPSPTRCHAGRVASRCVIS